MKKIMKRFRNERGLTLVELLAVVVILGIIGTIAFVMISGTIENSKKDSHVANAQQLISAAKLYEANGNNIDGDGVEGETLISDDYLEPLIDPWKKEEYGDEAEVTKSGSKYRVKFSHDNCDIDAPEKEVLKGRDAVCDEEFEEEK